MSSIQEVNKARQNWKRAYRAFSKINSKLIDQPHLIKDKDFCIKLSGLRENLQSAFETYKTVKSELVLL